MKNKKILMIITIITLISFIIGFSYAYFTTIVIGNDTASSNITTSGSLKLTYNGTDYISLENSQPGDSDSMTFTVTNTGSLPVTSYLVNFSNVINTYAVKSELVYEIDCTSSDAVTCLDKSETEIPSASGVAITQGSISPGTTHTYTLTVTFTDTLLPQDYNQNKSLMFKITIDEQLTLSTLIATTYVGSPTWSTVGYFWDYKDDITSITFEKGIDIPVGAAASWDVSAAQDGSIMAYIIGSTTYDLYFQTESDFLLSNPNSSYLFYNFTNLTTINNLSMLRTYYVTNMNAMFNGCASLTSLDVSTFDTSSVTTMSNMFFGCNSLTSLDLSTFDTSSVTTMSWMFSNCHSLTSLDLSTFDTSSVINMSTMFHNCIALTSLEVSSFDTSSVTNMLSMFANCSSLTSLNLSTFDTSSVTTMSYMFISCSSLTSLEVSSFDTSSVTSMYSMFQGCSSLTSLDLSTFDTSSVTTMYYMFYNCSSLTSLDLSTFDTSSVTNMSQMFSGCSSLTSLDFRLADFTTVTTYTDMFRYITSGITITVLDSAAQTWINARLTNEGKTGTVVIA